MPEYQRPHTNHTNDVVVWEHYCWRQSIVKFVTYYMSTIQCETTFGGTVLTVNIFDRYMEYIQIHDQDMFHNHPTTTGMRDIVAACMLIASKVAHVDQLTGYCVLNAVGGEEESSLEKILYAETRILGALRFRFGGPTADVVLFWKFGKNSLHHNVKHCVTNNSDLTHSKALLELFCSHRSYPTYTAIDLASAAFLLSRVLECDDACQGDLARVATELEMTEVHIDIAARMWEHWCQGDQEDKDELMRTGFVDDVCCM